MSKFEFNGRSPFDVDLTGRLKIGALTTHKLHHALADGRVLGLLVEDLLACEVNGLAKAERAGASHDLFCAKLRKTYECKTSKEGSFSVAPSRMKGVGRKFNAEDCMSQIMGVEGLLLGSTSSFPRIEFAVLRVPEDIDLINMTKSDAKVSAANWARLRLRK
jgi:hypothetical protein